MDDQKPQGKFFRWEHHRYLVDWIRAKEYYSHFFPSSWFKTTGRNKNLWSICRRAPKNFGRGWSVELMSANSVCSPWASARPKTGFAVAFFLRPKLQTILNFGVFSWKLKLWFSYKPYLVPYFLILWPNQKWDVLSTAVAQPRLVKLYLRWQDVLGLFFLLPTVKIPL